MAARVFNFNPDLGAKGIGGYDPRGCYVLNITASKDGKSDAKDGNGVERGELTGTIVAAFTYNAETKKLEANAAFNGKEKRVNLNYPDGKSEGGDKAREQELKAAIISAKLYTPDQLKMMGANTPFDIEWFTGRQVFIRFDPPPAGSREYPVTDFMSEDKFAKVVNGQDVLSWPYDGYKPKEQHDAAAGHRPNGAGGMLPSSGAPTARPPGAPPPTPAPAPAPVVAAPVPAPPPVVAAAPAAPPAYVAPTAAPPVPTPAPAGAPPAWQPAG